MPLCTLRTNVPKSSFPNNFEGQFGEIIAQTLDKSLEKVILQIESQTNIRRGGKQQEDPLVWLAIHTIGCFKETNSNYSNYGKPLKAFLAAALSVDETNIVISLHDLPATHLL